MSLLVALIACGMSAAPPEAPSVSQPAPVAREVTPEPPPPAPDGHRYAASHVLVAWHGAAGAATEVTRTESDARDLALAIHARALAGEPVEQLARELSDGPSGPRGGGLGAYETGTMIPAFEAAVASVEPGSIAPLVRTPFGFHVARRDPVEIVRAAHLVVPWSGAWRSTATRTKSEARARAEQAAAAIASGEGFASVALRFGEDETATHGGTLGEVTRGQLVPAFEQVLFSLEPGAVSDVVETPYGFHLVRRVE
ncbi:MAG: hypothetical protein ACI8PZ_006300 [Myxococcota bacterium]